MPPAHLLILTSEVIWYQLTNPDHTLILSPQEWDIQFYNNRCIYTNTETGETDETQVDGILLREGHVVPDSGLATIINRIKQTNIPIVNHPDVTLLCMDDVRIRQLCLQDPILQKFCKFAVHPVDRVKFKIPTVIKLPNYHGGKAKWKIDTQEGLAALLDEEITITWGSFSRSGYLNREPYLSEYIVTEPVVKGRDLRIYTYLDREVDEYYFKYLERVVRDDQWMANVHTKSYELHDGPDEQLEAICLRATSLLGKPDLVGIDFLISDDDITILEINNDVPGLASMQMQQDFTIHQQLLKNLEFLCHQN